MVENIIYIVEKFDQFIVNTPIVINWLLAVIIAMYGSLLCKMCTIPKDYKNPTICWRRIHQRWDAGVIGQYLILSSIILCYKLCAVLSDLKILIPILLILWSICILRYNIVFTMFGRRISILKDPITSDGRKQNRLVRKTLNVMGTFSLAAVVLIIKMGI